MESPTEFELDFAEHWGNSIYEEVLRGKEIRNQKLKTKSRIFIDEYDFANIDFDKPSCSKYGKTPIKRKMTSEEKLYFLHVRKKRNKKVRKNKRSNGSKKCQLRIAELAVPTKRYCIETWRSKWDTLPNHMVDRLRQIVLDQKPIVPVDVAISCFKRNKKIKSRSSSKRTTVENKDVERIKLLCAVFGYRIIERLITPRNLTLSTLLIPISHVINDEVSYLLQKSKSFKLQDNIIQKEIVNKITNWIAEVVEQSNYNMMLEDYKELEKEEGHIWDIIEEIVQNAILLCKEPSISSSSVDAKSSDSYTYYSNDNKTPSESKHSDDDGDDEFGNLIADVIENVIKVHEYKTQDEIKTPTPFKVDDIREDDQKTSTGSLEGFIKDIIWQYIEKVKSELIDPSSINNRIDNTIANDLTESGQNNVLTNNDTKNYDITETRNELTEPTSNGREPMENIFNDIKQNEMTQKSSIENAQESDGIKHNFEMENNNKAVKIPSNKNQVNKMNTQLSQDNLDAIKFDHKEFNIANDFTTEENNLEKAEKSEEKLQFNNVTSEDSLKKVKFSNINIDSGHRQLNGSGSAGHWENNKLKTINMYLAPRNDNLLSEVDEPWPENLTFPVVKATVSVSKSILSLGRIMEDEEKYPYYKDSMNPSIEESTEVEQKFDDMKKAITNRSLINDVDKLNSVTHMKNNEEVQCVLNVQTRNVGTDMDDIHRIKFEFLSEKHLSAIDIYPDITIQEKPNNYDVIQKDKKEIRSDENNYSIPTLYPSRDIQLRDNDIRIWCKGLYNVTENLDMWLDWINNSCNNILYLHQKEKFRSFDQNKQCNNCKRFQLRTNIDSDAILWKKLYSRLQVGLRSYKQYYIKPEVCHNL